MKHGGKRKGAGRPKLHKQKITISLSLQSIQSAKCWGNSLSEGIEKAIKLALANKPVTIFNLNGLLNFSEGKIATIEEYESSDRCVNSIFEGLGKGSFVCLKEGIYQLNSDLDLIKY